MRLSSIYLKHNPRAAQNVNKVPFYEVMPLKLKNRICGSTIRTLEDKCLYEMTLLFGCWKENNFEDSMCNKEMKNLYECYNKYMKNTAMKKELQRIEIPNPNAKNLTSKQITYLLRMYPTV
ncbi:coiled-coil-helix-coiled-coil-helix domain-containing protein 1 isoform X1 [Bombus pyrosoma]|uniref:coiled-coil-helix-coiled-coil-helix domain-containing protein 1 isoform X1 n=1 Tax=Bombus pyrosoma TaxID=396416 RepID=UPI001CB94B16|nr:coiled-coil-helix-coiled-coil-helix domain-containing protein 1 isoform X1 [Bombus pyrosoma]XP_043592596.1 coiled-coil-helix-coiled-coil-helix domain-containing protein 1 isoform X1 [Bombus pyrosoma]